jgi:cysteine-rich repeat protein
MVLILLDLVNYCRQRINNMPDYTIPQKPGVIDPFKNPLSEPVIKTMPEKYIGAAAGKPPVIREIVETKAVPPPPPKPASKVPVKKNNKRRNVIIISVAVLLLGVGAAAFILFMPATPVKPVVNANKPVVVINTNTTPPPLPVCGNGLIESGEQCDSASLNGVVGSGCTATCTTEVAKPALPPNTGVDSDSDGLTDVEEKDIYGTDSYNFDTDHDTFNDGNEVSHLYDPNKKTPALLKDAKSNKVVADQIGGYSVVVPAAWSVSGQNTDKLMVTVPSGEFFQVMVVDKPKDQSLIEWYMAMSPGTNSDDTLRFKTVQGYDALRSPDRITTYIDPGNGHLYTLSYSFDDKATLEFRTTYEAFVQGFALGLNGPNKP